MQIVANHFSEIIGQGAHHAAKQRIRDAIVVTQWADTLPRILRVIEDHGLVSCQDNDYRTMKTVANRDLAPQRLSALRFSAAAGVVATVSGVCGALSGAEKFLFAKLNACSAFWTFIEKEEFYGE